MRLTLPARARSRAAAARWTTCHWEVLDRNGNWLATEYNALPRFVLQAGDYTLRLKRGHSTTEKAFSVTAGDAINVAMTLDVGKLMVSGVYAAGGSRIETGFTVEIRKPAANAGEDGEWVATNYDPVSQFDLPSGSYDVVASVGFAKRVARAEVRSGAPTRIEVTLDAGIASIRTGSGKVIEIFSAARGAGGERKYVQTSYDPTLTVALNAGQLHRHRRIRRRQEGREAVFDRCRPARGCRGATVAVGRRACRSATACRCCG